MSADVLAFLRLGAAPFLAPAAYGVILFVAALVAAYPPRAWRPLGVLVGALALGHAAAVALALGAGVGFDGGRPEVWMPAAVLAASVLTVVELGAAVGKGSPVLARRAKAVLALGLGLVHGLAVAAPLERALGGAATAAALAGYALGVVAALVGLVLAVLAVGALVTRLTRLRRVAWALTLAGLTAGVALTLLAGSLGAW